MADGYDCTSTEFDDGSSHECYEFSEDELISFANLIIDEAVKVCADSARDCERLAEPIAANYLYECAAKISAMKEA